MRKETFADRLKYAMDRRQVRQVDLIRAASARGIRLGKSHVSQYVSGKTVPRAEIIRFLAAQLEVEESWLAGGGASGREAVPETGAQ